MANISQRLRIFLFCFSFLIMAFGVMAPNIFLEKHRHHSHGTDDHLAYVVKAANIKNCFDKTCNGLQSIYNQAVSGAKINLILESLKTGKKIEQVNDDIGKSYWGSRHVHRLIYSYHPIYSYSLVFISNTLNVSLEKSQFYFEIFISLVATISVCMFLTTFFNLNVAIIIMPFLGYHFIGGGWGIHNYAPFVVAIPPILIAYSLLAQDKKFSYIFSLILMIISSGIHPSGIVMSGTLVLFLFLKHNNRFEFKQLLFYFSSLIVFVFYFYHLNFIPNEIKLSGFYVDTEYTKIFRENIKTALKAIELDGRIFLNIYLCLILMLIGLFSIIKNTFNLHLLIPLAITLLILGITGIFFPSLEISLLKRVWVLFALFGYGVLGYGILSCFKHLINLINLGIAKGFLSNIQKNGIFIVFLSIFTYLGLTSFKTTLNDYVSTYQNSKWNANILLSKNQVNEFKNLISGDEKVFYNFPFHELSEPIVYFYMANGANTISNIWPILNKGYEKEIDKKLKYMVNRNPMTAIDKNNLKNNYFFKNIITENWVDITGDIFITEGDEINLYLAKNTNYLGMYVENKINKSFILTQDNGHKINIPSNFNGWLDINLKNVIKNKINFSTSDIKYPIRILGFKTSKNQSTFYPWNTEFKFEKNKATVKFLTTDLIENSKCKHQRVINDFGSSVLSEINCS